MREVEVEVEVELKSRLARAKMQFNKHQARQKQQAQVTSRQHVSNFTESTDIRIPLQHVQVAIQTVTALLLLIYGILVLQRLLHHSFSHTISTHTPTASAGLVYSSSDKATCDRDQIPAPLPAYKSILCPNALALGAGA